MAKITPYKCTSSDAGGREFDTRAGHTKYLKNGSNGFPSLALRIVGLALRLTRWYQDKLTSKLHRKRRVISVRLLKAA